MRGAGRFVVVVLVSAMGSFACDGVPVDTGADSEIRVEGASFRREPLPAENGGPRVVDATVAPRVSPGTRSTIGGSVERSATSVVVALEGDRGYWIVPAGIPDVTAPGFPTFRASVSFGASARVGARMVLVRAVDEGGRFGAVVSRPVTVRSATAPEGSLVISLRWDNDADLDLHVEEPGGNEIYKGNRSSAPTLRPGEAPDASAPQGGILDLDANGSCVAGGRRTENVIYAVRPPRGRYVVRVDTFSLCDRTNSYWHIEALLEGNVLGAAEGIATEVDTRFPHGRGGGLTALEIDVP